MIKEKICKICKIKFTPNKNMFCPPTCNSYKCMTEYAMKHLSNKKKLKAKESRAALKKFNDSDINVLKRRAIYTFNKFIRLRDNKKTCVSCGIEVKENMAHASHFKPANTYSYLRFDESNVHKSCSKCNVFLSGNLNEYRIRIVDRIGEKELIRLDKPNQFKKWTAEEYNNIIDTYKQKIKQLNIN